MNPIKLFLTCFLAGVLFFESAGQPHLLGMTYRGGGNDGGVLFSYTAGDPAVAKQCDLFDFSHELALNSLMVTRDGKVYGLTKSGGPNHYGNLFRYDYTNGTCTLLMNFDFTNNGGDVAGKLLEANDGRLYGLTEGGSGGNSGRLFSYAEDSTGVINLYDFISAENPHGYLIQAANGGIYGLAMGGGDNGGGYIFHYDISSGNVITDYSFPAYSYPWGSLLEVGADTFYGLITGYKGFIQGTSTLFRYIASTGVMDTLQVLPYGSKPVGSLIRASDGKLYGTLSYLGSQMGNGSLFSYDIATATYTDIYDCTNTALGANPDGTLYQASDGMLYGTMTTGGDHDQGTLFRYNISTQQYTKLVDMDSATGSMPGGALIEVPYTSTGINPVIKADVRIYAITGTIVIKRPDATPATVVVTNMLGQKITETTTNSTTINLPVQSDAIYIVQVTEPSGQTMKKILVK